MTEYDLLALARIADFRREMEQGALVRRCEGTVVWPNLWGPGWLWDVLSSIGLLAGVIALLKRLELVCRDPVQQPDPLQDLWVRYEQGDLTSWEFQRRAREAELQSGGRREATRAHGVPAGRPVLGCCPRDSAVR